VKNFADLTEREVLAVAISSEEEDSRIYMTFAEDLKERYPDSAKLFEQMAEEERGHRHMLLELYEQRFGPHLPPIRREDVKGFLRRRPVWLTKNLPLDTIRREVETMELQAERFYVKAAEQAQDVGVRRLLGDLAEAEKNHEQTAAKLTDTILIRPGVPELDLLDGSATGSGGGSNRHLLELDGGLFYKGLGFRLSGKYDSGSTVTGGTAGDLNFGDLATFNLRFFADLNQVPKLTEKLPFLKGSRLRLSIDNLFDAQRKITDANGVVPLNYQPGYIDPLGRYIELEWRKTF